MEYFLIYLGDGEVKSPLYIDSDCAGNVTNMKNILGCCFSLGSMTTSWFNRK
jgi:hypothetical protein